MDGQKKYLVDYDYKTKDTNIQRVNSCDISDYRLPDKGVLLDYMEIDVDDNYNKLIGLVDQVKTG